MGRRSATKNWKVMQLRCQQGLPLIIISPPYILDDFALMRCMLDIAVYLTARFATEHSRAMLTHTSHQESSARG